MKIILPRKEVSTEAGAVQIPGHCFERVGQKI